MHKYAYSCKDYEEFDLKTDLLIYFGKVCGTNFYGTPKRWLKQVS